MRMGLVVAGNAMHTFKVTVYAGARQNCFFNTDRLFLSAFALISRYWKLVDFFYLRSYDTRTNQGYEGSDYGPGEVSLTSQTDDIKSMTKNSSR